MQFLATDPGYDTQRYMLETGPYGKFKFSFDYNETVHNITSDAKTFYTGAGSGTLTGAANTNPNSWNTFDYYTKRKKIDAGLKFDMARPFFFNVNYTNEKKEGIRPIGVSSTGSAGASLELPTPVDYRTNGLMLEGGYAKNPYFLSFNYYYNEFRNGTEDLNFTVPLGGVLSPLSLPPDNKYYKFALKGSAKLPLNSKFSINLADSKSTSEASIFTRFDGKVDTRNYDFNLTSNPLRFLDGKLYYKSYERNNKSTGQILVSGIWTNTNPLYYKADTLGAELGFRLPAKFYLNTGYKNVQTDRNVENETNLALVLPKNTDNIYFADLKWNGFDAITPRVGFESLRRSADYQTPQSENAYNRKFAYAAQDRDTIKAAVDLFPVDALNLGLEYKYKRTNYKDTALGFTDDTRNAFGFNADYTLEKMARILGYFDYEKAYLNQRAMIGPSLWDSKQEENTYGYGIRTDVYAIPKKLTFVLQYDYLRSSGSNNLGFYDNAIWGAVGVTPGASINIPNSDSYQKYSASFTTVYNWSESLMVRAGYTYARYIYSDAQLNGYRYYVAPTGGAGSEGYLTGAYSNPSYSANIVFLGLAYRFK